MINGLVQGGTDAREPSNKANKTVFPTDNVRAGVVPLCTDKGKRYWSAASGDGGAGNVWVEVPRAPIILIAEKSNPGRTVKGTQHEGYPGAVER